MAGPDLESTTEAAGMQTLILCMLPDNTGAGILYVAAAVTH